MQTPKVLFYGAHDALFQMLRLNSGVPLQVEQIPTTTQIQAFPDLQNVGLVVMLHTPPNADCLPAVRNLKRTKPEIPVIVATSDYTGPTTRLLLKSGAEDVLGLPATDDEVLACMEAYLPGYKLKTAGGKRRQLNNATSKALLAAVAPGMVAAGVQLSHAAASHDTPTFRPVAAQGIENAYIGLEMSFFGTFSVLYNGRKIEFTNQAKHLFAYLAYHHPRALSREHLARVFWPEKHETAQECARRSLNVELAHIRKTLRNQAGIEQDFLVFEKNNYRLKLERPPLSDVLAFKELHRRVQEHLRRGEEAPDTLLQEAIKTYSGNFLDDFPADTFSWIEIERQHLSAVFEQMADLYSAQLCTKQDYYTATAVCNEILSRDPRMEVIHRRAMQCYASLGMANKVEAQYNLCCKMMEQEFQSKPSQETVRLYEQIKQSAAGEA